MVRPPTIADMPVEHVFTRDKLREFQQKLEELNEQTMLVAVSDPADVMLTDAARTMSQGYRYSHLALRQVCAVLSSGLSNLVMDISGLRRTRTRVDSVVSVPAAARILNLCTQLRFQMQEGLYNRQLVVSTATDTIDGMLGAGYRYLPHADLINAVADAMADIPVKVAFESGILYGRHLTAVWKQQSPIFTAPDGKPVYAGYYITNSEAGECSVGAAVSLLFGSQSLRCILPVTANNRVIHAGKSFRTKLAAMLGRMLVAGDTLAGRGKAFLKLASQPLNLVDDAGKLRPAQLRRLTSKLIRCGLKPELASDMLRLVAWGGQMGSVPATLPGAAATRTAYDLFVRICHQALAYPYIIREMMEKAAFELLNDKIKFD